MTMTNKAIIATCVAIVTSLELVDGASKPVTSAVLNINGNTIQSKLDENTPNQFEVGKEYDVSFSPVAANDQTQNDASKTDGETGESSGEEDGEQSSVSEPEQQAA